jgi:predicted DNA-binding transcriptional regulator YafY
MRTSKGEEPTMPKSSGQKLRILKLLEILNRKTDEGHQMTSAELICDLERQGIEADRKTVYDDLQALEDSGYDLIRSKGKKGGVRLLSRDFALSEVKMLVDAVQSSRFITESKSRELTKKLGNLVSMHQEKALARHFYNGNRVKSDNKAILYAVDAINEAINSGTEISFYYWNWNHEKQKVYRHGKQLYTVSPWELTIDDNNYYLIAYDEKSESLRHYRVDKMANVTPTETPRKGKEKTAHLSLPEYRAPQFGMFGGESVTVKIKAPLNLAGVFIDRFGQDVILQKESDELLTVRTKISPSPQFYGWLFGLGQGVSVTEPPEIKEEYEKRLQSALDSQRQS